MAIETTEELIAWFDGGQGHDPLQIERMARLSPVDPGRLFNLIYDTNYGMAKSGNAWITRQGRVYNCGWGQHEVVSDWLMCVPSRVLEEHGWVRVSHFSTHHSVAIHGTVRPSAAQVKALKQVSDLALSSLDGSPSMGHHVLSPPGHEIDVSAWERPMIDKKSQLSS